MEAPRHAKRWTWSAAAARASLAGALVLGCAAAGPGPGGAPPDPGGEARAASHLREGRLALAQGRPGAALRALGAARALAALPGLEAELARACQALGRPALAAWYARRALAADPEDGAARLVLAETLLARGRSGEAEHEARRLVGAARGERRAAALLVLGRAVLAQGRSDEARRVLARVAARGPAVAPVALARGVLERAAGRPARAAAHFDVALAARPDPRTEAELRYRRAETRLARGDCPAAAQDLRATAARAPGSVWAARARAWLSAVPACGRTP